MQVELLSAQRRLLALWARTLRYTIQKRHFVPLVHADLVLQYE